MSYKSHTSVYDINHYFFIAVQSQPSENPSISDWPTSQPSGQPSSIPSESPSVSSKPSSQPSENPSVSDWPTSMPSSQPSSSPSSVPSVNFVAKTRTEQKVNVSLTLGTGSGRRLQTSHRRLQLSAEELDVLESTLFNIIDSSLDPQTQRLMEVTMISVTESNGELTVEYEITLFEICEEDSCESGSGGSSLVDGITSSINEEISNGGFDAVLQAQAASCGTCDLSSVTVVGSTISNAVVNIVAAPSSQPSVSLQPSVSSNPSQQPSISDQPSISSNPSFQPSGRVVSTVPSSQPSSSPSQSPSSQPSQGPSSQPSGQPSSQPSSQPSQQPSCTPSSAPTNPDTMFLFYPDWSPYGSGCNNDGKQPNYMTKNPGDYLFSTLDSCCSTYFNWNYDTCMGLLPGECARELYYPDWNGSNEKCIADGNEPQYSKY